MATGPLVLQDILNVRAVMVGERANQAGHDG